MPLDSASPEHCLVTDAVYKAMGITAFFLSDHVDFSTWFMSSLAPILQVCTSERAVVVCRRVCRVGRGAVCRGAPSVAYVAGRRATVRGPTVSKSKWTLN